MEKRKFTASNVLEQLFDDDSDFSGSDSNGEGEGVYAYQGPTMSIFFERGRRSIFFR